MKRKIIYLAFALCLLFAGCSDSSSDVSGSEHTENANSAASYVVIESPYKLLSNNAKNPWDMVVFDGKLYVGAGDYDKNISPNTACRYALDSKEWEQCGTIPDEQIDRFCIIGGTLCIPGCDPKEDWTKGNFYRLEDGGFKIVRTIPNGVHCFDMAEHDGKIFAALGHAEGNGNFPVAVSDDGGYTFTHVPAESDEQFPLRVYKLFLHGDELYALNGFDLYRYDEGRFVKAASWQNGLVSGYHFYTQIAESVYFKGRTYFTTGYLFHFEDPNNLQYITFEQSFVTDVAVYNDMLYVLCASQREDGGYLIWLVASNDGQSFETVTTLEYPLPALSFAICEDSLYLGIGDVSDTDSPHKGEILKIEAKQ